jgi:hypothetical protein
MVQRCRGDVDSAKHPCKLFDSAFFVQHRNGRQGSTLEDFFRNAEVMGSEFGNLRQVSDADDLMVSGKLEKFETNDLSRAAADTGIDFIEDDGFDGIGLSQDGF